MKTKKTFSCIIVLLLCTVFSALAEESNHSWVSLKEGMNCLNVDALNNSEITVEFWMYASDDDVKDKTAIVFQNNNATSGIFLYFTSDEKVVFKMGEITSVWLAADDLSNKWVHVSFVITNSNLIVYGDGKEMGRTNYSGGYISSVGIPFWIGPGSGWSVPFTGKIADFRIWNVARTQQEILDNMNNPAISSDDLLIHYTFQERAGDHTANLGTTGSANTGWVAGAAGSDKSLNVTWSPAPTGASIVKYSDVKYHVETIGNTLRISELSSPSTITCYSVTGRVISKGSCEVSEFEMELQDGISIIQIHSEEGVTVQKVVI